MAKGYQRHSQKPYFKEVVNTMAKWYQRYNQKRISKKDSQYIQLLIMPLISIGHCIDYPLKYASGYACGICWPLYWLFFFDIPLLVMPLVSFGPCIDCPSLIYGISKKDIQYNGQQIPKVWPEATYQRRTVNTMAKRYQRHNQKPYIKEEQSIQWPTDTKGITRSVF
jgi:hypothetical protein